MYTSWQQNNEEAVRAVNKALACPDTPLLTRANGVTEAAVGYYYITCASGMQCLMQVASPHGKVRKVAECSSEREMNLFLNGMIEAANEIQKQHRL